MRLVIAAIIIVITAIFAWNYKTKHGSRSIAETVDEVPEAPAVSAVDAPVDAPVEVVELETREVEIDDSSRFAERAEAASHSLTSRDGVTIEVEILKIEGDSVTIKRLADGLETRFKLDRLSAEDRAFCEYLRDSDALSATDDAAADNETESATEEMSPSEEQRMLEQLFDNN